MRPGHDGLVTLNTTTLPPSYYSNHPPDQQRNRGPYGSTDHHTRMTLDKSTITAGTEFHAITFIIIYLL